MRFSFFKLSILLIVIGASGTGIVFSDAPKTEQQMTLEESQIRQMSLFFEQNDVGYHTIFIPEFEGQGVFFRVVDPEFETISKGLIQTKMSIGYFDVKESGMYTVLLTNLAQKEVFNKDCLIRLGTCIAPIGKYIENKIILNYEVEIGSTAAQDIIIPAGVMFAGGLLLLFASYLKLKNYRTEQPDENIR